MKLNWFLLNTCFIFALYFDAKGQNLSNDSKLASTSHNSFKTSILNVIVYILRALGLGFLFNLPLSFYIKILNICIQEFHMSKGTFYCL